MIEIDLKRELGPGQFKNLQELANKEGKTTTELMIEAVKNLAEKHNIRI